MKRRVAVTGVGVRTPIGNDLEQVFRALVNGEHGIHTMSEWSRYAQLETRVAGLVDGVNEKDFPRKKVRTLGRVGLLALAATESAVEAAGLDAALLDSPRTGLCYGSTHGSSSALEEFCRRLFDQEGFEGIAGSAYLKFMSHTCAANLAQFYGIRGRVEPTISACTSASQAIGSAYESILLGKQDVVLAGGAEEMHFVHAGVFDIVFAASSRYNERPELTPRPFDAERDGLVVAEGAGTLVLEEWEHARARGADIVGELVGYGMACDGTHVTNPSPDGMARAMALALEDAGMNSSDIGYVNAHATATEVGDIAEAEATHSVFGVSTPVSSTKGHMGHTLGACGAIEAAIALRTLHAGVLPPTRNLIDPDERCAPLDHIRGEPREASINAVMSNNFAFGGIDTSLIFRRV